MVSDISHIPREALLSAEFRAIDGVDLKAANICYQREDFGANYHRAWTRRNALEDSNGQTPLLLR